MSTAVQSPNNPFRNRSAASLLTPNPTGQSVATAAPSYHSQDPLRSTTPLSTVPPSFHTRDTTPSPIPSPSPDPTERTERQVLESTEEEDDLPPAYTPAASIGEGETTIGFGPRRPFQPSNLVPSSTEILRPPLHPAISVQSTGSTDFYNAGGPRFQAPAGNPPSRGFVPPPGTPPAASGSGIQRSQSQRASNNNVDNNGRPTPMPVPGHPLMRDGNVLVYPPGYQCWKCANTGYKAYDPTHPCRKCWERYSIPYNGPIAQAPWPPSNPAYQKALPNFKGPSRSSWSGYPGCERSPSRSPGLVYGNRPPPGAIVVQPGDPRIGGRLCWRCDGSGLVSFLIFDEDTCPVCNGTGRTFQ